MYRGNPFIIEEGLAFGKAPDSAAQPEKPAMPLAEGEQEEGDLELARVIDSLAYLSRYRLKPASGEPVSGDSNTRRKGVTTDGRSEIAGR